MVREAAEWGGGVVGSQGQASSGVGGGVVGSQAAE